jgi:hypothetical protein
LKEVASSQEITKSYWNYFQYEEANKTLNISTTKQFPSWVMKMPDNEYVMLMDSYNSAFGGHFGSSKSKRGGKSSSFRVNHL